MTDKNDIVEQLESFDVEVDAVIEQVLKNVEDYDHLEEWLEKVNGDFGIAKNLYGLPIDMTIDEEEAEHIIPFHGWINFDPADPPRFTCPICNTDFIQVETGHAEYAGYGAVNQFTGHITGTELCGDSSGQFYDETEDHETLCQDCARGMSSTQPDGESSLRVFRPNENDVMIRFQNGVRFDEGTISSEFGEYRDLPKYMREAVSDVVLSEDVRNMNKVSAWDKFERSFTRRGMNQWVHSMIDDPDEYHFDFPVMAVSHIRQGYVIAGGVLYTPKLERYSHAKEEVESWTTSERMNEFRRDRMR